MNNQVKDATASDMTAIVSRREVIGFVGKKQQKQHNSAREQRALSIASHTLNVRPIKT